MERYIRQLPTTYQNTPRKFASWYLVHGFFTFHRTDWFRCALKLAGSSPKMHEQVYTVAGFLVKETAKARRQAMKDMEACAKKQHPHLNDGLSVEHHRVKCDKLQGKLITLAGLLTILAEEEHGVNVSQERLKEKLRSKDQDQARSTGSAMQEKQSLAGCGSIKGSENQVVDLADGRIAGKDHRLSRSRQAVLAGRDAKTLSRNACKPPAGAWHSLLSLHHSSAVAAQLLCRSFKISG